MNILDEPLAAEAETAAELHIQPQTLRAWRIRGQGPRYVRVGKLIKYRSSDIRDWVQSRVTEPASRPAHRACGGVHDRAGC